LKVPLRELIIKSLKRSKGSSSGSTGGVKKSWV